MSPAAQAKKIARQFIDDQKKILEEFGDSAIASKYKDAVTAAEKTFRVLCSKPKQSNGNGVNHAKS